MSTGSRFDKLVDEIEWRAADAAELRDIAARNPDLILTFAEELRNSSRPQREPGQTQLGAIASFLRGHAGPVETSQIADATGIDQSAVRSILYGHTNLFLAHAHPEHSAKRLWTAITSHPVGFQSSPAKENGALGPTATIIEFLRSHPEGATVADIVMSVGDKKRTEAEDKRALTYGTLTQLEKRGKVTSAIHRESGLKVFRLVI